MTKSQEPYLLRINQALTEIASLLPLQRESFLGDRMLQHAVSMLLFQIGENLSQIRHLDDEAFQRKPDSWHQLVGLRNIIAHGYETIEPARIWIYLNDDLDSFRKSIEASIHEQPDEDLD